ncbi:ras-like protein rasD [Anneissia japonica]|uniref:ras-like protein rasD n=1 Tax=Anneissia japonica TaxID=1529436 RepID=UPI0014258990|nr:ras-like protein rasD [Anneissia japonica]XP_033107407.1 ras-like protein rasD [Anneissia japonica]
MRSEKGSSGLKLRIVLLGEKGVGKSAIAVRFLCGRYLHEYDPNLECCYDKHEIIDGKTVKIEIFDTAGQDVLDNYLKNADAVLYVYSITSEKSFAAAKSFREELLLGDKSHIPVILLGNKRELEQGRQVSYKDGFTLARETNWKFYEMSAAVDTHRINDMVLNLASELLAETKKSNRQRRTWKIKRAMSILNVHIHQPKHSSFPSVLMPLTENKTDPPRSPALPQHPRLANRRQTCPAL